MRDEVTSKIANAELGPIAKFVADHRGTIPEITRRLEKITGRSWNRNNVERWLHRDEARRNQPLLGIGLLLMKVGNELMTEAGKIKASNGKKTSKHS